jgi:hypothetical protein
MRVNQDAELAESLKFAKELPLKRQICSFQLNLFLVEINRSGHFEMAHVRTQDPHHG